MREMYSPLDRYSSTEAARVSFNEPAAYRFYLRAL